ncbi:MAG: glycoside hydrolase family 16 protein [Armatimonadota bacterium]
MGKRALEPVLTLIAIAVALRAASPGLAAPSPEITSVPPFPGCGSAQGRISGVNPANYRVALLIYIPGLGWWSKPYCEPRVITIGAEGNWSASICSGGVDSTATIVEAYLIPASAYPACYPNCVLGADCVPESLKSAAVACGRVVRPGQRVIRWSGIEWFVKSSGAPVGPGPNWFSSSTDNVWLDAQGRLHLRITHRNNAWQCAEIISSLRFGYGTYRFYVDSPLNALDPNVVFSPFVWSDFTCAHNHREIDIEFSRWGNAANANAQYIVQPDIPGNKERFEMPACATSTHAFTWTTSRVDFWSVQGHCSTPSQCTPVHAWTFGQPSLIPPTGDERVHINLYLVNGQPPTDGKEVEVILSRFEFEPYRPAETAVYGITGRSARQVTTVQGSVERLFRVWGRVVSADCDGIAITDGSPGVVRVLESDSTLSVGDYVICEGKLDSSSDPPVLDASFGRCEQLLVE